MTLFDAVFGATAIPLMEMHGSQTQIIATTGDATATFYAMVRALASEWLETEIGRRVRVDRASLIVPVDASGGYGGIDVIQSITTFEFDGFVWAVDDAEGRGIQARTGTFAEVFVRRVRPIQQSFQGHRVSS